jgi:hypothetical protein
MSEDHSLFARCFRREMMLALQCVPPKLVSRRGSSRADAKDVGNRPGRRILVVLFKRGFVAADHFQLHGTNMHVELRFRPSL